VSWLGAHALVWIAIAAVLALVWRRPSVLLRIVLVALAAGALSSALKLLIDRPRPVGSGGPEPLVSMPTSSSMPSGHALVSFACAATLAALAPRLAIPLYVLAAAIAWSRVVVGVHYPSDVIVGAALGVALATALRMLEAGLRRSGRWPRRG